MTISSHKIYGPTGIGGLFIRKSVKIKSLLTGGAQERNRRAGTHHVAGIIGFSTAASYRYNGLDTHIKALKDKRDYLLKGLEEHVGGITLNGSLKLRHPGSLNITFEGIDGETLLMNLDLKGIAVSAGSACSSGAVDASHVLLALGLDKKRAKASIRLSVGDFTSIEDLDYVIEQLKEIIDRLRG
jgi:cysteine desulfurase